MLSFTNPLLIPARNFDVRQINLDKKRVWISPCLLGRTKNKRTVINTVDNVIPLFGVINYPRITVISAFGWQTSTTRYCHVPFHQSRLWNCATKMMGWINRIFITPKWQGSLRPGHNSGPSIIRTPRPSSLGLLLPTQTPSRHPASTDFCPAEICPDIYKQIMPRRSDTKIILVFNFRNIFQGYNP